MLDADSSENFGNDSVACTAERCVNNLKIIGGFRDYVGINLLGDNVLHKYFVKVRAYHCDKAFVNLVSCRNAFKNICRMDIGGNIVRHLRCRLSAVFPVELVAVIYRGVV